MGALDSWATAIPVTLEIMKLPMTVGVVNLGQTAKAITVGGGHTCALLADNTVKCWGPGDNLDGWATAISDFIGDDETPTPRSFTVKLYDALLN